MGRRLPLRLLPPQSHEASADRRRRAQLCGGRSDTHRQVTGVQLHFLLQLGEELVVEGLQLVREEQRSKVKPRTTYFRSIFLSVNSRSDGFVVDILTLHRS